MNHLQTQPATKAAKLKSINNKPNTSLITSSNYIITNVIVFFCVQGGGGGAFTWSKMIPIFAWEALGGSTDLCGTWHIIKEVV